MRRGGGGDDWDHEGKSGLIRIIHSGIDWNHMGCVDVADGVVSSNVDCMLLKPDLAHFLPDPFTT